MGVGAKVDCTICIDELHLGDEVTVLPCKHWFHGECVVPFTLDLGVDVMD